MRQGSPGCHCQTTTTKNPKTTASRGSDDVDWLIGNHLATSNCLPAQQGPLSLCSSTVMPRNTFCGFTVNRNFLRIFEVFGGRMDHLVAVRVMMAWWDGRGGEGGRVCAKWGPANGKNIVWKHSISDNVVISCDCCLSFHVSMQLNLVCYFKKTLLT